MNLTFTILSTIKAGVPSGVVGDALLLETGDTFLLETGDRLLLE